ncbi:MAG: 16S rRNA (uracil(1498)-N(3))-methyltransferase [Lachnospiraceae bacterium]|nr:16S rRNA (uracil(1498)-N(3))-methyltransferase [Lachnospiraceae bacterium]
MYHFFIDPGNISGEKVYIEGGDVNHIKNVLRMQAGEQIMVSDGEGSDYLCEIESMTEQEVICSVLGKEVSSSECSVKFYLFQGLPKSDKLEHVIQKSVELGVYEIIPTNMSRCIVKYDDKKLKNKLSRWQGIAESAAKQSHRGVIPEVKPVMNYFDALKYAEKKCDMILVPYENHKGMKETKEILAEIKPGMSVAIFVGPEGGFADKEIEMAEQADARIITLGNRILRTETAPLMLLSVLTFMLEG